jgi:hypothetical protein
MNDCKDPTALATLAQGLSQVAAGLGAKDAAHAVTLLSKGMRDARQPQALASLAEGLSKVASRMSGMEAERAAKQATIALVEALMDSRGGDAFTTLTAGLSAVARHLQARDAATIAATLLQAMTGSKDLDPYPIAEGLSVVAARLGPKDAVPLLPQAIQHTRNPNAVQPLVQDLSAVVPHMAASDATRITAQVARNLVAAAGNNGDLSAQNLSTLLSAAGPTDDFKRGAMTVAACSLPASTGHPVPALIALIGAEQPPPCRLSTQQVVDLLKMPTCHGPVARVLLDQLGRRYDRTFGDPWEFVRFAQSQHFDLDLTTPPQRPERGIAAANRR